jgi:hypothetical protein
VGEGDRGQVPAARRDDRPGAHEDEREGADELREPPLECVSIHDPNRRARADGSFEGSRSRPFPPTYNVSTAERKAAMSAEILKRKLRNFPVASLSQRITAIS